MRRSFLFAPIRSISLAAMALAVLLPMTLRLNGADAVEGVLARGSVVFETGFGESDALAGWSGPGRVTAAGGRPHALVISNQTVTSQSVTRRLPVGSLRGCSLRGTVLVRAQNVSAKPQSWNGIKFIFIVETASGKSYPQAPLETGSFDWQRASAFTRIPEDATNLVLVLGLEQVSGEVWFDDVKILVGKGPLPPPPPAIAGPRYRGHSLDRLRGAMVSPNLTPDDLRVLGGEWNANLIRFQLIRFGAPGKPSELDTYDAWLQGELKKLDSLLPACRRYGIKVVLDLHSPPGGKATVSGYVGSDDRLFTDPRAQDKFVEVWRQMANRYRGEPAIWAYDLANEPVEDDVGEGCEDWQGLAERAARAVRLVDPERALIIEPAHWGGPDRLNDLRPLSVSNVVYSVHMYLPHAFTHQGVHGDSAPLRYPGEINGKHWGPAELERALEPAITFQQRYNVQIYIGEFSAIRWAPDNSAVRYLRDLIEIFERHGWDWSYHAFREWDGWSVEHGSARADRERSPTPTDRQKLLQEWFGRNRKS